MYDLGADVVIQPTPSEIASPAETPCGTVGGGGCVGGGAEVPDDTGGRVGEAFADPPQFSMNQSRSVSLSYGVPRIASQSSRLDPSFEDPASGVLVGSLVGITGTLITSAVAVGRTPDAAVAVTRGRLAAGPLPSLLFPARVASATMPMTATIPATKQAKAKKPFSHPADAMKRNHRWCSRWVKALQPVSGRPWSRSNPNSDSFSRRKSPFSMALY